MDPLYAIVAYDKNRLIGKDGGLPWHYPEDLKYFKKVTMGHAIIHGRKSYEDFGKPLPGRRNIIVTRQQGYQAEGCEVAHDLKQAIILARESDKTPFILGGAQIYAEAMPQVTRLYITEIDADHRGDTYFPPFNHNEFTQEPPRMSGPLTFRIFNRR